MTADEITDRAGSVQVRGPRTQGFAKSAFAAFVGARQLPKHGIGGFDA
jgi:hypothetical protein